MNEQLLNEFAVAFSYSTEIPKVEAIIILKGGNEAEDTSRINYGIALFKMLTVPVIFSGVTDEKEQVLAILRTEIPTQYALFQDCGERKVANTLTQFQTLSKDFKSIVVITNAYHIPRVRRTAKKHLPTTTCTVVAPPNDFTLYNPVLKMAGEVKKIHEYSQRGDIDESLD